MSESKKQVPAQKRCFHGEEAIRRQVQKEGLNKGRFFWSCPRPYHSEQRCAFFSWDDVVIKGNDGRMGVATKQQENALGENASTASSWFVRGRVLGATSRTSGATSSTKKQRDPDECKATGDGTPNAPLGRRLRAERCPPEFGLEKQATSEGKHSNSYWLMEILDLENIQIWPQKGSHAAVSSLIQLAERIPGAVLEQERIRVPLASWPQLCAAMQETNGSLRGHPPHKLIRNLLELRRRREQQEQQHRIDMVVVQARAALQSIRLWDRLLPFQRTGVEQAIRQGGRLLLADEMGLGKTVQAIAVAWALRHEWPVLVVCPSSLRDAWRREWMDHVGAQVSVPLDITIIQSAADAERPLLEVNIVSYELVNRLREAELRRVGVLVLDESHYIKSSNAKRTQFLLPWLKRIPRVLLLTGTPALSRPAELYTQLHGLAPAVFSDWIEFAYRYCGARNTPWKAFDTSGATNLAELHRILSQTVMIRRRKTELLNQLPQKKRSVIVVETEASAIEHLRSTLAELASAEQKANAGDQQAASRVKALMSKAFQMTAVAKVRPVLDYCAQLMKSNGKFLLFGYHELMLDAVETWLKERNSLWIRIDGKTEMTERQSLVDRFQRDPQCRVALLALTAAGAGLTLTAAHVVIFAELYWNPGTLRQAEDRVHRIGQRETVSIRYLMLPQSLDERMWRSVQTKLDVLHSSLDGKPASKLGSPANETVETLHRHRPLDRFFKRHCKTPETEGTEAKTRLGLSADDCAVNGHDAHEQSSLLTEDALEQIQEPAETSDASGLVPIPHSLLYSADTSSLRRPKRAREARTRQRLCVDAALAPTSSSFG